MDIEKRQERLSKNGEALDYWIGRMLRAANQVDKLRKERKRLLSPMSLKQKVRRMSLDEIRERAAIGGSEFNDEIPS